VSPQRGNPTVDREGMGGWTTTIIEFKARKQKTREESRGEGQEDLNFLSSRLMNTKGEKNWGTCHQSLLLKKGRVSWGGKMGWKKRAVKKILTEGRGEGRCYGNSD